MSDLTPYSPHSPVPQNRPPANQQADPYGVGEEETVDLREIIGVLRRHVVLIAAITLVTLGIATYFVLRQVPEYRAAAVLRLQDERGAMTGGLAGAAMEGMVVGKSIDPILSQVQVLRSRGVAAEVIDSTGLRLLSTTVGFSAGMLTGVQVAEPGIADTLDMRFEDDVVVVRGREGEVRSAYGDTIFLSGVQFVVPDRPQEDRADMLVLTRQEAVVRFNDGLGATIREQTDVIDLTYVDRNPEWAQRIANTTIAVFQNESAEASQQQARRRRVFLEEQLTQTDSALTLAQLGLTDFQRREGVSSSQEKLAAQQTGLMALDIRREELDADRRVLRSMLAALSRADGSERQLSSLISSPEIAANPVVVGLFQQLVRLQSSRDSLTSGDGAKAATNPDVQRLSLMIGSTRGRLVEAVTSHAETLDARLAALDDLKGRNLVELQALPVSGAEEVRLIQRVEGIGKVADQLREEYQKARIAEAVEAGQVEVIDLAVVPTEPIGSGRGLKLILGLMLGLMLGGGAAFLKEHLNTSIQRREDIEGVLQVPGLAVIPQFATNAAVERRLRLPILLGGSPNGKGSRNGNGNGTRPGTALVSDTLHELITVSDLRAAGSEAFRTLRTNLIFSQAIASIRTLVVTSSAPAEGKTTTAANLAVTFGQQGMKVLILDCDLRKARLHNVFGVPREPGLTHLVLGFNELAEVVQPTGVEGLDVLPAGALPPNPSELLGGTRMREVMKQLSSVYDLVIIDTPPLLAASDASVLGRFADGVLLVVRAGHTDRGAAQQALQQLRTVGARVLGAVLNDPDAKVPSHGGYYYYDYSGSKA